MADLIPEGARWHAGAIEIIKSEVDEAGARRIAERIGVAMEEDARRG